MPFAILYSFRDDKGKVSTTTINVPSAEAFADVVTFAGNVAALIDPLISGQLTRIGVAFTVDLPGGIKTAPTAVADVEEGARFQFRTAGNFFTSLRLPTFLDALVNPGSDAVDLTDPDVDAFVTAMTDGIDIGGNLVEPCDPREDDIGTLEFAREQFQSSRGST